MPAPGVVGMRPFDPHVPVAVSSIALSLFVLFLTLLDRSLRDVRYSRDCNDYPTTKYSVQHSISIKSITYAVRMANHSTRPSWASLFTLGLAGLSSVQALNLNADDNGRLSALLKILCGLYLICYRICQESGQNSRDRHDELLHWLSPRRQPW